MPVPHTYYIILTLIKNGKSSTNFDKNGSVAVGVSCNICKPSHNGYVLLTEVLLVGPMIATTPF